MPGLEPDDFAGAEAGPDAGKKAQRKKRHGGRVIRFHERHEFLRLRGVQGLRAASPPADPVRRNSGQGILGDPFALQGELEETGNDAAAIVVGLPRGPAEFKVSHEPGWGQV